MSTDETPASEETLRRAAVMWAFVIRDQAQRLTDSVDEFNAAALDGTQAGNKFVPWNVTWKVGADAYFFLSAAAQLRKCVSKLDGDGLPESPDDRMIHLLRNFHEHWEDPTGWSASELRRLIPDAKPGRLAFTKHDVWIENVSVNGIVEWTSDVENALRSNASRTGATLPNPEG